MSAPRVIIVRGGSVRDGTGARGREAISMKTARRVLGWFALSASVALVGACDGDPPPGGDDAGGGGMDAGTPDAGGGGDAGAGMPDLSVDPDRAAASARIVWEYFEADDCALVEGCVTASGWRRLLRFETFTPNHGTADFRMGPPEDHPELFEYSECHGHYHYNGYADYQLLDGSGALAGMGHKQAFCLMDSERVLNEAGVSRVPRYDCSNQGISRGWGDSYYAALDCQWIDVTDVAPGTYSLRIEINGARTIEELSYDDNVITIPITVPDDATLDPTAACDRALDGPRDCGWTSAGSFDCTAGTRMRIGCGSECGLGSCSPGDDAILRVCPGDTPCTSRDALAYGDDGCGDTYCPLTEFTCPAGGRYTVLVAPYLEGDSHSCTPAAAPAP